MDGDFVSFAGGVQAPPSQVDRWWIWPTVASILATFAAAFLCGLPGIVSLMLILLSPLVAIAGAVTLAVFSIRFIAGRQPRRAISLLVALLLPIVLWQSITSAADFAHLALTVGTGAGQIGKPSGTRNGAFEVYDWSVGLAGGPNTFLIHDVTDEIALPLKGQRRPAAEDGGFGEACSGRVKHLLGHYYVCTI